MDSSLSLVNVVAAAINFFAFFFLFSYRSSRFHQENKTMASSLSLLSPPSSLPHIWKHHVFPSFHGADVRKTFLSHILKELRSKGIDLFIDNNMERSKSIGLELIESIRGSRIAIVLLSKNYASSTWCLDELVEIIRCREELDQTVVVLFYEVDPTDVKKQTGDFVKVFRKTCKGKTKDDIRRWKHALAEVAKIAGYHSRNWELAWQVTRLAGELPLGLRVMGSYFRGMSKKEWTNALPRLIARLDGEIESILMFSYDALCDEDKCLFLHIACFFKYDWVHKVESCLANSFSDVTQGLHVLAERSLVSMDSGRIEMHNLLVQLGREIVRKQSVSEPRKRQFLDDAKDIGEVLSDDKADSSSVVGIDLRSFDLNEKTITCTSERAFERLSNLQFLRIEGDCTNLYSPQSLNSISRKLRSLSWAHFLLPCLPSNFDPKFLVELDMRFSKLEKLWEGVQPLSNLKWMNLCSARGLKEIPDLSTATNLKELNLSYCSSLVELHSSVGHAINLQKLDLSYCTSLVELPTSLGNAINLQKLDLSYCTSLVELPSSIGNAIYLQKLELNHCSSLVDIPSSIRNVIINFQKLDLSHCSSLVKIPSSIESSTKLKKLDLSHCTSLVELPYSIGNATNLQGLNLSHCSNLVELPFSIANAISLQHLDLSHCTSLVQLPSFIGNALNFQHLNLSHCSNLVELPYSIGYAINLQYLNLRYCSSLMELPSSIGSAVNLQELYLGYCSNLVELPSSMKYLRRLWKLELKKCSKLQVLLANINLESLEELNISGCSLLKTYPETSTNAEHLKLSGTAIKECLHR